MKTKKDYEFTTNFLRKTILKIVIHEQKFVIHFFMKKHIDFLAFFLKKPHSMRFEVGLADLLQRTLYDKVPYLAFT